MSGLSISVTRVPTSLTGPALGSGKVFLSAGLSGFQLAVFNTSDTSTIFHRQVLWTLYPVATLIPRAKDNWHEIKNFINFLYVERISHLNDVYFVCCIENNEGCSKDMHCPKVAQFFPNLKGDNRFCGMLCSGTIVMNGIKATRKRLLDSLSTHEVSHRVSHMRQTPPSALHGLLRFPTASVWRAGIQPNCKLPAAPCRFSFSLPFILGLTF